MKTSAKDYVSAAQQFFTAYDAHEFMACSLSAQMARSDDMLRMAARASCQSAVASMLFGARFRMPFRTSESK